MHAAEFHGATAQTQPTAEGPELSPTGQTKPQPFSSQLLDGASEQPRLYNNFLASQTANSSLPITAQHFKACFRVKLSYVLCWGLVSQHY